METDTKPKRGRPPGSLGKNSMEVINLRLPPELIAQARAVGEAEYVPWAMVLRRWAMAGARAENAQARLPALRD